ncbi:MAG: hypothetical protein RR311_03410 [Comamonas sp.]
MDVSWLLLCWGADARATNGLSCRSKINRLSAKIPFNGGFFQQRRQIPRRKEKSPMTEAMGLNAMKLNR